jgi:hypothetical protein
MAAVRVFEVVFVMLELSPSRQTKYNTYSVKRSLKMVDFVHADFSLCYFG